MHTIKLKCLISCFLLVATAGILFIFSYTPTQQTDMSSFGIIAEDYTWEKRSISVCWADKELGEELPQFGVMRTATQEITTELNDNDKLAVQKKVQEQFNKASVGIEFVGWQKCDPAVKPDMYIFAFDEMAYAEYYQPGEAEVGTSCEMFNPDLRKKEIRKRVEGQPGYIFLSKATIKKLGPKVFKNPEVSFIRSSLHEFGHVAGLLHEHYHKDAKNDPNCQDLAKDNPDFMVNPISLGKEKTYSKYDPQSIMNGCFLVHEDEKENQNVADIKLSESDRHTLQCIYKSADQYDKSKCQPIDYK